MNHQPPSGQRWPLALLALLLLAGPTPARAARIAEPETVIYGRIVQRLGPREFPLTRGTLVWTFRTGGPHGHVRQLTTSLQSLADGRFSYLLRLPHQALAYDLAVADSAVPLAAVQAAVEHLSVTLNGHALAFLPAASDPVTVSQQTRAASRRIDLELVDSAAAADSDGDGLPDWWEDERGFDKWDPADAAVAFPAIQPLPATTTAARTFAEWRASLFPGDSRDLEVFAQDDPDHDGISNLLEYAFDLNPVAVDADAATALPHLERSARAPAPAFRRRTQAVDLTWRIEASDDLLAWRDVAAESGAVSSPASSRFFRVLVIRNPQP